jgi:hypothetical protein
MTARRATVLVVIAWLACLAAVFDAMELGRADDAPPTSSTAPSATSTMAAKIAGGESRIGDDRAPRPWVTPLSSSTTTTADATPIETAPPVHTGGSDVDWYALADCESGDRVNHDDGTYTVIAGTARWDIHDSIHEGGLQFAVPTWDGFAPAGFPDAAWKATPAEQIAVAELVADAQGPGAWPECSEQIGWR